MSSILNDVKKMLGITEDYTHFDLDIIAHINSVLGILAQVGVGSAKGFLITGPNETWADFLKDSDDMLYMVKSYVYLRVKLLFDPPTVSSTLESYNRSISELEWRLYTQQDLKL